MERLNRSYLNESTVSVHLTNKCNMRCPHCYQKDFNGYDGVMDVDKVFSSIDTINPETIIIYGGEPLLFPDIVKKIFDKYEKSKHVIIATNGTIWNPDIFDRAYMIMTTVETFLFNYSDIRTYTRKQYDNLMKLIETYSYKLVLTHNIYPRGNDPTFMKMARLMSVDDLVKPYPIVDFCEEQELDSRIMFDYNIEINPLINPKLRILPDGTITKDMRGHYNDPDKNVPVHEKCISCQYNQYCPSYKMFPHFAKDVLDKIEDPHFCKTARWIYNHENKVLS